MSIEEEIKDAMQQETREPAMGAGQTRNSLPALYWVIGIPLLLGTAFLIFWYTPSDVRDPSGSWGPPSASLKTRSDAYAEATRLFSDGEYVAAVDVFLGAIEDTTNRDQRAQVAYKVALSTEMSGNYMGAIRQYMLILGDESNSRFVRAYAALRLSIMYTVPAAQEFVPEIFAQDPFKSFRVEGDREATKRNMHEYVSSIYPLPQSELSLGAWHADQALRGVDSKENTDRALAKLASADSDIPRIEADENERSAISDIMKRRATLIGYLAQLGVKSHEEASAAFEKAIPLDTISNNGDLGFTSYFYAVYLERAFGAQEPEKVRAALRPYYTPTMRTSGSVVSFFAGERMNRQGQKERVAGLAAVDPEFKKYLLSLGWKDVDFE